MSQFDPANAKYVSLITFRKTGKEVRTPVWIAPLEGKHYVFSEATAGKMKRLKNNPAIKMALCDVRGKILEDTWLSGEARVVDEPDHLNAIYGSFNRKYGLVMRVTDFFSKLSGRYNNRAMIEITLT